MQLLAVVATAAVLVASMPALAQAPACPCFTVATLIEEFAMFGGDPDAIDCGVYSGTDGPWSIWLDAITGDFAMYQADAEEDYTVGHCATEGFIGHTNIPVSKQEAPACINAIFEACRYFGLTIRQYKSD